MRRLLLVFLGLWFGLSSLQAQNPGDLDLSFNADGIGFGEGADGWVYSSLILEDGKILIGGGFSSYHGSPIRGIARLEQDGKIDPSFNSGTGAIGGAIKAMALQSDGKIIIGGTFTSYNGNNVNRIARLNSNGTLDLTFSIGLGFDSDVNSIAIQPDGKILIGGFFSSYNNQSSNRLVRLNSDGTLDYSFSIGSGILNGIINKVLVKSDSKILIGGTFLDFNGVQIRGIAQLFPNGSIDLSFNSFFSSAQILDFAIQSDGKVIISGQVSIPNQSSRSILRINPDGSIDGSFESQSGGVNVNRISIQPDGKVLFSQGRGGFGRLNSDGSSDNSFSRPFPNDFIESIQVDSNGKIFIAGNFTQVYSRMVGRIARLNPDGDLDNNFNPSFGPNGFINVSAIQADGKILIGGTFNFYNGLSKNNIVRLNPNGSLDLDFNTGVGFNSSVRDIKIQSDGKILVAGSFTSYNGQTSRSLIRLNQDGSIDSSFNIGLGFNSDVFTIGIDGEGKIVVGGGFNFFNSIPKNYLLRLNEDGSLDNNFNGQGFNSSVTKIDILSNNELLVGGNFTSFNNSPLNRIAKLDEFGVINSGFVPPNTSFNLNALKVQSDGKILIGGTQSFNCSPFFGCNVRAILFRLNPNGSFDSFNSIIIAGQRIRDIEVDSNGKILVSGDAVFRSTTSTDQRRYLSRLNPDGSLDITFNIGIVSDVVNIPDLVDISIQSDGKIVLVGSFKYINNTYRNRLARVLGGGEAVDDLAPVPNLETLEPKEAQCIVNFEDLTIPTATDNVDGEVQGTTDPSIFPITTQGTTTITWTFTDEAGNESIQEQEIIIEDTQLPTIQAGSKIQVNAEENTCEAVLSIPFAMATDNCSVGEPTGVRSDNLALTDPYPVGVTIITWTVTDVNGNEATPVIQTITVTDTQAPVITTNGDQNLEAEEGLCGTSFTATANATDNCLVGEPTGVRSDNLALTDPYPVGQTTITWTVTDVNGNEAAEVTQTITVSDTQAPEITTNGDQNLDAEEGLCVASFTETADATDNCSVGEPIGVRSDNLPLTDPYPVGVTTITWTVTDTNGNDAIPVVQTITVTDTQAPVITTDGDQNLDAEEGLCSASFIATANTTDNCSVGEPTGVRSDNLSLTDPYAVGVTTITWTVTDVNGNDATPVVQTITVTDTQAPVITTNGDQNLEAEEGLCVASFTATANATDNCLVGEPKGVRSDNLALTDPYPVGVTTITWTVTDVNGNDATEVTQTITVSDTQAPEITTNGNQNLEAEEGLCTAIFTAIANGTDNCSVGEPMGVRSDNLALTDPYPVGQTTITWTVTDVNGNEATPVIQTITVSDTQAPEITTNGDQNLEAEEGLCTVSFTAIANATDNCSVGEPMGVRSDYLPLTDPYPVGVTTITWTVSDVNGNEATPVVQTITVTDTQVPVITTNGNQNLNAEEGLCAASFTATADATDNCSVGEPTGVRSDNLALTDPYPVGVTTITWIVTDTNGNEAIPVVQTITVNDNQAPIITTNGDQNLDAEEGLCAASFTATANVTDNCSVGEPTGVRSDNLAMTDPYPVGVTTITWTVTDVNGNEATPIVQTITVSDTQAPEITTNGDQNLEAEEGLCTVSFTAIANATDNCSVGEPMGVRSDNLALTDPYPVGVTTITWTVTDVNGNEATPVVQTITVTDTQVPIWQTVIGSLDQTVFCGQDQLLASAQELVPVAFDNCSITSIIKTSGDFISTGPNGAGSYTNTWITFDMAGNESEEFTQVITVQGIEVDASASSVPVQLGNDAQLSASVIPAASGVRINFYLDEEFKGSSLTNSSGVATLSVSGLGLNVYKVTAEVGNGCSNSVAYLPVYDPNGNFVTGGGWINSPEGALVGTTTVGKANFGFVSKYKKGSNQVDGNTEFQFNAGNLNFKSTLHEAGTLVISGRKATYRGNGTVNGLPGYRFTITAIDGQWNGGTGPDQFRIKIWGSNGVLYDNGLGADDNSDVSTVLGGGSIVIHEAKGKGTKRILSDLITVDWNTPIETIQKELDQQSSGWFEGRKIALTLDPSSYDPLRPGLYILKANLTENEWFELDGAAQIQVLVKDKPMATDILAVDSQLGKELKAGSLVANLKTIDPVDNIHQYQLEANDQLELRDNQLIWKGGPVPAILKFQVSSTDRAGQTISKEITLTKELRMGEFLIFPNPAEEKTQILVELDQPAQVVLRVFDASGKLVISDQFMREETFVQTLDLMGIAPGMYTVQVQTGKVVMTGRLIKK